MANRHLITSGSPFEKAYGYSRAVVKENWVFVAGTTGYDYTSMIMPETVAEQTRQCWKTILDVLQQAGCTINDIVRCTYYVTSAEYTDPVLDVCGSILREVRPAATIVIVSGLLRPEMKVEIEVTALK